MQKRSLFVLSARLGDSNSCLRSYSAVWFVLLFDFFFFNDTATTEIYTLSLHDALPICALGDTQMLDHIAQIIRLLDIIKGDPGDTLGVSLVELQRHTIGDGGENGQLVSSVDALDRKSTRLNSSHVRISYAVFCLKKKKK